MIGIIIGLGTILLIFLASIFAALIVSGRISKMEEEWKMSIDEQKQSKKGKEM